MQRQQHVLRRRSSAGEPWPRSLVLRARKTLQEDGIEGKPVRAVCGDEGADECPDDVFADVAVVEKRVEVIAIQVQLAAVAMAGLEGNKSGVSKHVCSK
jgi:hypothetical protein